MNYGYSVGLSAAGVAFVGCPQCDTGNGQGLVYVYTAGGGNFTSGDSWTKFLTLSGYDTDNCKYIQFALA
jgi:hypothetical protein